MDRWIGQVAFVTGTTSGIGEAIAEKFVDCGLKVVGFARRKERLDALTEKLSCKKGKFYGYQGDVTKEEDVINAFKWTIENVGPVSVVVNNAGVSRYEPLSTGHLENWRAILDTNVLGVCVVTREAIKHMRDNLINGHIININSVSGHRLPAKPVSNLYPPSKHAVTALTNTLRMELANEKSKIKITSLSPGLVESEFLLAGNAKENLDKSFYEFLLSLPTLKSSDIADAAVYILSTPPNVNISELIIEALDK